MQTVRKAGQKLDGNLYLHDQGDYTEANDVFRIANSWRDSHFLLMCSTTPTIREFWLGATHGGEVNSGNMYSTVHNARSCCGQRLAVEVHAVFRKG